MHCRYQLGQTISKTSYGDVKLCLNSTSGGFVVMQPFPKTLRNQLESDAAILMAAPHPHVVAVLGTDGTQGDEIRLFTECVSVASSFSPCGMSVAMPHHGPVNWCGCCVVAANVPCVFTGTCLGARLGASFDGLGAWRRMSSNSTLGSASKH